MAERFDRSDARFLLICAIVTAASLFIGLRWFDAAFPEASIDFRFNRQQSKVVAETFLTGHGLEAIGARHASEFSHDEDAKVYLERTLGLEKANEMMRRDVRVWYWRHRWFTPLVTEEVRVDVAPTGEIVGFDHRLPEELPLPPIDRAEAIAAGERFLAAVGVPADRVTLVAESERKLPKRLETILTWESRDIRPGGAPYRHTLRFEGDRLAGYSQKLRVPDQWLRDYAELRSKNTAAASVDTVFILLTILAALVVFIVRLRRGDVQTKFAVGSGIVGAVLVALVALNAFPSALAGYDTTTSYSAFVARHVVFAVLQGVGVAVFLIVIVGSGEALYRERFRNKLAMPSLFRRRAITSKRVFHSFVLGYTLVAAFFAYQVVFYVVSSYFGAWSPAEIPYDNILNTAFPWVAVLFMGFFPSMSEEFMSRAFSIPFLEKLLRSRVAAIVIAGFIWGFGHTAYPNQPFYIRGIEVGVAGVIVGILLFRFGLLPLLIWHYTIDALYTSVLLFRSNNVYYVVSAVLASMVFALPLIASLALYRKNRGFDDDRSLENEVLGTVAPPPVEESPSHVAALPARSRIAPIHLAALLVALAAALVVGWVASPSLSDLIDYRIDKKAALAIAADHLHASGLTDLPERSVVVADAGFRSWNERAQREDGGSPGGFDRVALDYILTNGRSFHLLIDVLEKRIEAATWVVRFFTPRAKEEVLVEVDPRRGQAIGMHHYLEQTAEGVELDAEAAEVIAAREIGRYGLDAAAFDRKEALSFQQPRRRDWLFHFEERQPIVAEAYRRVSVRVSGDRVSQFAETVRIPEKDRREERRKTLANIVQLILKIAGSLAVGGIIVVGYVLALRGGHFPWRRAARWSILLAIVPLASAILQLESFIADYDTSIEWNTFLVTLVVGLSVQVGVQLAAIFLAITALEMIVPVSLRLLSEEGRRLTGGMAVVAGLTATAILLAAIDGLLGAMPRWFPGWIRLDGLEIPQFLASPFPALIVLWQVVMATLLGAAAVAAVAHARTMASERRRWLVVPSFFVALTLSLIDAWADGLEIVVTFVISALTAALIYALFRFVLHSAYLAIPVAIFTWQALRKGMLLLQNDRVDLQLNGWIVLAVLVSVLLWVGAPSLRAREGGELQIADGR
ncbi:MAG TPA: CPBP family intramembrane glutamic endopeptidase [Thermoanaerobaculia bacterium]|nr:CPBP family intramembrane glutamic endopeptidase [Thermoanaerobaculia bacterium]